MIPVSLDTAIVNWTVQAFASLRNRERVFRMATRLLALAQEAAEREKFGSIGIRFHVEKGVIVRWQEEIHETYK